MNEQFLPLQLCYLGKQPSIAAMDSISNAGHLIVLQRLDSRTGYIGQCQAEGELVYWHRHSLLNYRVKW